MVGNVVVRDFKYEFNCETLSGDDCFLKGIIFLGIIKY